MENDFVLLTEKERMWAEMLMQVLKDNDVLYVAQPVVGAGLALNAGTKERFKILVPMEYREKATELMFALFPEENP